MKSGDHWLHFVHVCLKNAGATHLYSYNYCASIRRHGIAAGNAEPVLLRMPVVALCQWSELRLKNVCSACVQVFADACGTLSTTLLSPQPPTGAAVLGAVGRACLAAVGRVLRETAAFQEILATSLQHSLVNPLAKLVDTGFADSAALSEEAHRRRSHSFEDNNRDGRKGSENSAATRLALVGDLAVRCNALATAQRVQDEIERQKCLHLAAGWNFDAKDGDDHLAPSSVAVKVPQSESGSLAPIGGPSTTSHTASGSTTRNKSKRKSLEEEMIDEKLRHARCNLVVRRHDVVTATREAVSHARIVVSESSVNAVLALNNWAQQLWQVIRGSNAVVAQVGTNVQMW